jgi:putative transposase
MCLDKGYDYDEVYAILQAFGFTAHVRPRGEEARAIKQEAGFRARRRVVERAHSWAPRFRRLVRDYERLPGTLTDSHLAVFACLLLHQWMAFSSP